MLLSGFLVPTLSSWTSLLLVKYYVNRRYGSGLPIILEVYERSLIGALDQMTPKHLQYSINTETKAHTLDSQKLAPIVSPNPNSRKTFQEKMSTDRRRPQALKSKRSKAVRVSVPNFLLHFPLPFSEPASFFFVVPFLLPQLCYWCCSAEVLHRLHLLPLFFLSSEGHGEC